MCPSKAARGNDTATDPSTGAAATSATSTAEPDANDYNAATTTTEPGTSGCAERACQEEVDRIKTC